MTKKDKREIVDIFNQVITELILPVLDQMNNKMATKDDIKSIREEMATKDDINDIQSQLDSIERKIEAQQIRSDSHGKIIDQIRQSPAFA
ncbi:hypothetical protein A2130_03760 [Candidatus Woesebacteria bacterium GWC2_33_12]|uniref:Uncharacterized protein n=1 Tax=Candidatus Woesebacteria bacterium GW2011_GWB1_33_22 TaxID=1618566 RepID=A0A0F9ZMP3_9BACT|nr:MAG: hypothetical protein UR29_C0001G0073 [Candidatus Woesebacteria bacterium GW2011_GWC2_33_12]KKP42717.1 MAG: hypothetical protein UR33_C0001G0078 [Candidatus Woesebacteria bacterium GW2011_GWA2_33_20]KKP45508.1 MAG: hypothetical protein UR35_C0001G0105 [Candidatus Woesebacteria bacterium GW2011_GWB1_33_22]KKP47380.1 MAG: hypothetical protein UR37_C0001G0073 [Microgenomates group bacterium GW2011_GWC1_33_28]KKP51126.1 MAG: hypothetical protein UR41_C0001G0073 [Candidatus Woesebacteria bact